MKIYNFIFLIPFTIRLKTNLLKLLKFKLQTLIGMMQTDKLEYNLFFTSN